MSLARHIQRINQIASGPGAIRLPNVKGLKLMFREKGSTDSGAAKFWKTALPQVQFHNPQIPIAVSRQGGNKGLAQLVIKLDDGSEKSIEVSNKSSEDILKDLMTTTDATKIHQDEIPILKDPNSHEA